MGNRLSYYLRAGAVLGALGGLPFAIEAGDMAAPRATTALSAWLVVWTGAALLGAMIGAVIWYLRPPGSPD